MREKRAELLRRARELAATRHGVITRDDLRRIGMHDAAISRAGVAGLILRQMPGTYVVPGCDDHLTPIQAALTAYPAAVASRRAAAYLWRLDGIEALVPDILVPAGCEPRLGLPHRAVDLQEFDVAEVEGMRATNATRTLCDLGAVCAPDVVERAMESALRQGLTSVPRLEWRCAQMRRRGRPGPSALAALLDERGREIRATESDLETIYLQCLRDHGVPLPVRQYRVVHEGRFLGRLDMAYPPARVFIELDGWAFHRSREAFERDRARQNDMVALGWAPLRFTWRDVNHRPAETAARTLEAIAAVAC
jgi:very-short-patch-repair endonuclease